MSTDIGYSNYEKIIDDIMWLSPHWRLRFTVQFKSHPKDKPTVMMHSEYGYWVDNDFRVNITRQFTYYLSIDCVKVSSAPRISIPIYQNNIYFLKSKLSIVESWFIDSKYKNLFVRNQDGSITITEKNHATRVQLLYNNYIEFEPAVLNNNSKPSIGVLAYLSSDTISMFMDVTTFLSFKYFIDTFNMYQAAITLVNYLGRPDNGTNYTSGNQSYISDKAKFLDMINGNQKKK